MNGILITTDDEMSVVAIDESRVCDSLASIIGNGCRFIEIVHPMALERPLVMVVDEEGLCKTSPVLNYVGSMLYGSHIHGSAIVGNIVILQEEMTEEGAELVGMNSFQLAWVAMQFKRNFKLKEIKP